MTDEVPTPRGALEVHRRFGDVRTIRLPRHARHRSIAAAVRAWVGERMRQPAVEGEVA